MNKYIAVILILGFLTPVSSVFAAAGGQKMLPGQSPKSAQILSKIDLNKATAEELGQCPGLNAALGKAIVEYRSKTGPFKTPEDLLKVKGLTKEILNKIKPKMDKDLLYITPAVSDEDEEEEPSLKPSKC